MDASHLISPQCFLSLPSQNPPHPFPVNPPADATDPYRLYQLRFYRHSAELCREQLLSISSPVNTLEPIYTVFRLWSIRLSALLMARMGGIAREESLHMGDLGADRYRVTAGGKSIVPWNLRLLVIRVQAGTNHKECTEQYHFLSQEARANTQKEKLYLVRLLAKKRDLEQRLRDGNFASEKDDKAGSEKIEEKTKEDLENTLSQLESSVKDSRKLLARWKARLRNLGLFTASGLIGMRDTKTALSLLQSLYTECSTNKPKKDLENDDETPASLAKRFSAQDSDTELAEFRNKVIFTQAMLYLQIGDTISAREWFAKLKSHDSSSLLGNAMCAIADADWDEVEKLLNDHVANPPEEKTKSESGDEPSSPKIPDQFTICKRTPFDIAVSNNLSLTKANRGDLSGAVSLLEGLVFAGVISPTVMTNLSILYDLQQEAGRKMKNNMLIELRKQGYLALENYDFLQ